MKNFLIYLTSIFVLTACGGEKTLEPFSVSFNQPAAEYNELNTVTINIQATGTSSSLNSSLDLNSTGSTDNVTITKQSNSQFSIVTKDLSKNELYNFTLTVTDGNSTTRKFTQNFNIKFLNSSFNQELNTIETFVSQKSRLVDLTEEKTIVNNLKDLNKLLKLNYEFSSSTTQSDELLTLIDQILVSNYKSGIINETELRNSFFNAKNSFLSYSSSYVTDINNFLNLLSQSHTNPVSISELFINSEYNSVSYFNGNEALGSYLNEEWQFNKEFSFLTELVSNSECTI